MLNLVNRIKNRYFSAAKKLAFDPAEDENDELIRAIGERVEPAWQLEAVADSEGLIRFWSEVERDIESDISWQDFANDEF